MGAPLHCYPVQVGAIFGKLGYDRARVMLWCHGWVCKPTLTTSHIHIRCIHSVLAPSYAVNGHMGASLHCYTSAGGGQNFGKLGYDWAQVILCWGCNPLLTASHIHIRYIKRVLALSYAVDGHMGAPLHWYLCRWGQILEIWGMTKPKWCCGVMVKASNPHWLYPTFILDVYIMF